MKRAALIAVLLCAGSSLAHDPITTKVTFSVEIVRLFQRRCLSCHQEGGKAPMSLVKYEEARPWAKAIKEEVLERRMPPWGAVKGFGEFQHDRGLTQEEIAQVTRQSRKTVGKKLQRLQGEGKPRVASSQVTVARERA